MRVAKEKEQKETIDIEKLFSSENRKIEQIDKPHWVPAIFLVLFGAVAAILVFAFFRMSLTLTEYKACVAGLTNKELVDGYFTFHRSIVAQLMNIGAYIYGPLVPILAIVLYNYISKKDKE